jgi:hypothetical protein
MRIESRVSQLTGPFVEAWNGGDLDAFAALWTQDAIFWSASGQEVRGRDAIRAWVATRGADNLVMEPIRCEGLIDAIFVVGNFECALSPGALFYRGGFAAVLRETGERIPRMHRLVVYPERASSMTHLTARDLVPFQIETKPSGAADAA